VKQGSSRSVELSIETCELVQIGGSTEGINADGQDCPSYLGKITKGDKNGCYK